MWRVSLGIYQPLWPVDKKATSRSRMLTSQLTIIEVTRAGTLDLPHNPYHSKIMCLACDTGTVQRSSSRHMNLSLELIAVGVPSHIQRSLRESTTIRVDDTFYFQRQGSMPSHRMIVIHG